ncbi:MAG: NADH-quinone oxidoreductase subunit [Frankiaceae bacterium]|jgi:NADH-quinone oxidoreductase subunit D|nr:NADH-quinone oxidoreductase subunit [Frankiaceae bacterium]
MSPAGRRTATVAVGAGALGGVSAGESLVLDLGADHPSTHGGMRLALELEGDVIDAVITAADPRIGFVHRGAEKLFEVRDYRQILMLANRHDWLSSFAGEVGVALAVERLMGLAVPPRATRLRTALLELNRASAGLAFLGTVPGDDGRAVVRTVAQREMLLRVFEEVTGGRVHLMFTRIGGVQQDVPAGWIDRTIGVVDRLLAELGPITEALLTAEPVRRLAGVGAVTPELVDAYGLSGPVARAAGVPLDLRRDEAYLDYPSLDLTVLARTTAGPGDVPSRLSCLCDDVRGGLLLARECLTSLPSGPVNVRLPKLVRAPEDETYSWIEAPLGIAGCHLVSRGGTTPWRLKLRTPSFATLSALPAILPGVVLQDLPAVLASLFFVLGDADR